MGCYNQRETIVQRDYIDIAIQKLRIHHCDFNKLTMAIMAYKKSLSLQQFERVQKHFHLNYKLDREFDTPIARFFNRFIGFDSGLYDYKLLTCLVILVHEAPILHKLKVIFELYDENRDQRISHDEFSIFVSHLLQVGLLFLPEYVQECSNKKQAMRFCERNRRSRALVKIYMSRLFNEQDVFVFGYEEYQRRFEVKDLANCLYYKTLYKVSEKMYEKAVLPFDIQDEIGKAIGETLEDDDD